LPNEPGRHPYDNAKAESFMKTLKAEEVDGRLYRDHHEAEHCIGTFIAKPAIPHQTRNQTHWSVLAGVESPLPPAESRIDSTGRKMVWRRCRQLDLLKAGLWLLATFRQPYHAYSRTTLWVSKAILMPAFTTSG
jgi:transposase InsO family protein